MSPMRINAEPASSMEFLVGLELCCPLLQQKGRHLNPPPNLCLEQILASHWKKCLNTNDYFRRAI